MSAASGGQATPRKHATRTRGARWSRQVTENSHALDLEAGVFSWRNPRRIAESLRRSAERSRRRKADPFRSAMSMLVFYMNRAGRRLSPGRRKVLDQAKLELRRVFGKPEARQRSAHGSQRRGARGRAAGPKR